MVASPKNAQDSIRSIIKTKLYQDFFNELSKRSGASFCEDVYDAEIQYAAKIVSVSGTQLKELNTTINQDKVPFFHFV